MAKEVCYICWNGKLTSKETDSMKQKKQPPIDKVTAKKLKKLTWILCKANSLEEQRFILKLFEFYYHLESD